jgi:hypothetical protein
MGLPADALLLGALNKFYKFTPGIFDVWCALLRRFPHAFLVLVSLSRCLSPLSLSLSSLSPLSLARSLASSSSLFLSHKLSLSLPSSLPPLFSRFSLSATPSLTFCCPSLCMHVCRRVHILLTRQHTSAYVSIRQHTSAYVSIRQNTSAYVSNVSIRVSSCTHATLRLHFMHVLFLHVSSSYYMCVFILLYACTIYICSLPICVSSAYYMCLHTHLRLLYACTIYMFSSYICVLLLPQVSSYSSTPTLRLHYIYVLFLYMCPPPTTCVFMLIYAYTHVHLQHCKQKQI